MTTPTAPTWQFSGWITFEETDVRRLSTLRQHIQEVSDKISTGNFTTDKKAHQQDLLQAYLEQLLEKEKAEAERFSLLSGRRMGFTRGRAILPLNGLGPYKGIGYP